MTVTVRDVAASAQVSVATVSRVLSRSRRVGDANAKAVMDAADRLGYRPNRLAAFVTTTSHGHHRLSRTAILEPVFSCIGRARRLAAPIRDTPATALRLAQ